MLPVIFNRSNMSLTHLWSEYKSKFNINFISIFLKLYIIFQVSGENDEVQVFTTKYIIWKYDFYRKIEMGKMGF